MASQFASLAGAELKLRRASRHLKTINAVLRRYREVDFPKATSEPAGAGGLDLDTEDWQELLWQNVPTINPMLGAVLGDFVHNTRSALDQIMWQLVIASGGTPGYHTHFPVTDSENKWLSDIINRDPKRGKPPTEGLRNDALDLVLSAQPWKHHPPPDVAKDDLFRLSRMSNKDKHQTLHAVALYMVGGLSGLRLEPGGYVAFEDIEYPDDGVVIQNGAVFASVKVRTLIPPPKEDPHMHVKFSMTTHTVFLADTKFVGQEKDLPDMWAIVKDIGDRAYDLPGLFHP